MNTYKLQQHILIPAAVAFMMLFAPAFVHAADIDVVFEQTPLFANSNLVPGNSVSRTVTVTNNTGETQTVQVSVDNETDNGLADAIQLTITDPVPATHFNDTFLTFFGTVPVSLGTLGGGESRVYTFTALFNAEAGNEYQGKSMGFDLIVGFEGGESTTDCQSDCGGGGGGGGGGGSSFNIFNENVESVDIENGVVLSWNTNREATTYLVCGNLDNGPFILNTDEGDLFGYDFDLAEDSTFTEDHFVTLIGLPAGNYECRPASREELDDEFTVGATLFFTIPEGEVQGANFFGVGGAMPFGIVESAQAFTGEEGESPEGTVEGIATQILDIAKDVFVSPTETCTFWWLLIFPLLSLIWTVLDDRVRHPNMLFGRFFKVGLIFGGVFTLSVLFAIFMSVSPAWWWIFVLAWILYMIWDYQGHLKTYPLWSSRLRNIFFAAAGLLVILLSTFTSFICFVWPFVLLTAVSAILLFFDGDSGRDR